MLRWCDVHIVWLNGNSVLPLLTSMCFQHRKCSWQTFASFIIKCKLWRGIYQRALVWLLCQLCPGDQTKFWENCWWRQQKDSLSTSLKVRRVFRIFCVWLTMGFFCCCFQWTIRVKISSVLVYDHNGAPCQPTYIQLNWCLFFFLLLFVLHTAHLMHAYNGTKSNNIDSQLRIQFRFDIKHSGMRSIKKRTINENWRVLGWFSI